MRNSLRFLLGLFWLVPTLALADSAPPKAAPDEAAIAQELKLVDGLKYQDGEIVLRNGLARIKLPEQFRYLNPADCETILTKLWHNPPSGGTLGMIVPRGFNPLGKISWAVVMTYNEDGYIKDTDAKSMDYDKMMADMKAGAPALNAERAKEGYPPVELVGWAEPPRYDAATHKLYWAKEIKFGDQGANTLNYNIRILGRQGVLVLNAIAGVSQLQTVKDATPAILDMVNFQDGSRYADFNPDTDKVAAYGVAALVAGGIAVKVGLFKGIWVALLAAKKFIILAVVAIAGAVKKFWGRLTGKNK